MSDRDALGLIFASGFSTAATLSDISGRGVGMDIVKSNLEKIGGRILVESLVGKGSRFTIHLPLTLAIVRAVLVESGGGTYVLPLGNVVEMLGLGTSEGEIKQRSLGGQAVISLRGRTIPLANLDNLLCGDMEAARSAQGDNEILCGGGRHRRPAGRAVRGCAGGRTGSRHQVYGNPAGRYSRPFRRDHSRRWAGRLNRRYRQSH